MVERWSPKAKDRVDFDSENSLFYGEYIFEFRNMYQTHVPKVLINLN